MKMMALVSQLAISMLTAILICGGIGYAIDSYFGTELFMEAGEGKERRGRPPHDHRDLRPDRGLPHAHGGSRGDSPGEITL